MIMSLVSTLVAGITHNTHLVMTPEAKAKAELWYPGPPAGNDRAGRLAFLPGQQVAAYIPPLRYSANHARVRKCRLWFRNCASVETLERKLGGRLSSYEFINY